MGFIGMNENGATSEVVYLLLILSFLLRIVININLLHFLIITVAVDVIIPALESNVV